MIRVTNKTRGIICVDPPQEKEESGDPVADLLSTIDLSRPTSADEVTRLMLSIEVAKYRAADTMRRAKQSAERRARSTVDLLPEHQGMGKPKHVNDVPDELWRRIERMPSVAARIASGDLHVEDYPEVGAPF